MTGDITDRIVSSIANEIESTNAIALRCARRIHWTRARRIIAAFGTRIASTDSTTSGDRTFLRRRYDSIRPLRARTPACPSPTFETYFRAGEERESERDRAFEAAAQSLKVDERDPAAHWAMGRAL